MYMCCTMAVYVCKENLPGDPEAMELRIKDELMTAHGGLLMKWIDPDVMTGHNKCYQKRTTIRDTCKKIMHK